MDGAVIGIVLFIIGYCTGRYACSLKHVRQLGTTPADVCLHEGRLYCMECGGQFDATWR